MGNGPVGVFGFVAGLVMRRLYRGHSGRWLRCPAAARGSDLRKSVLLHYASGLAHAVGFDVPGQLTQLILGHHRKNIRGGEDRTYPGSWRGEGLRRRFLREVVEPIFLDAISAAQQ